MPLRQKRKLETTTLIHETAIRLARQNGVEAVTVEAICEASGISQRTFFNYFAFKEAVFVFPPPPLPEAAVKRFAASKGELLPDLIELMVAQATEMGGHRWLRPLMRQIAETYPRLMPLQMAQFQKFELQLQALIAQRLGVADDDRQAVALAGALIGVTRTTIDRLRDDDSSDLASNVRDSLQALVQIIRG